MSKSAASPEEEATHEQLARLEQLEKQLQELKSQPSPEEEPINQLNELQDQLDELEKKLSSRLLRNNNSKQEYTTNQLSEIQNQLDDLSKLSKKLEMFSSKNQLEKSSISAEFNDDIEDLKNSSTERKIIQTLQKQTHKLDEMEKKIQNSNISNDLISGKQLPEAYCVKCKTKQKILNSEEIQMKNGRPAVKGICSFCSCKIFKFLKIKNR